MLLFVFLFFCAYEYDCKNLTVVQASRLPRNSVDLVVNLFSITYHCVKYVVFDISHEAKSLSSLEKQYT